VKVHLVDGKTVNMKVTNPARGLRIKTVELDHKDIVDLCNLHEADVYPKVLRHLAASTRTV